MTVFAFAVLFLVLCAWLTIPFIPAIRELLHPTDDAPLTMVGADAGDLTVFANGFRAYLGRQLPITLTGGSWRSEAVSNLRDGTPVAQLNGRPELLREILGDDRTVRHLVIAGSPVRLSGEETFLLELYARADFVGGPNAVYRALLAESDAELGEGSSVMRWVHAEGILVARAGTHLDGRASAGREVRLDQGVTFLRIRAPRIVTGIGDLPLPEGPAPLLTSSFKLPNNARRFRTFVRIADDLTIPDGETFSGTLVVEGLLRVGAGARIGGSVKAHGPIVLGKDVAIDGSLVSRETIELGEGSRVAGPLIAERHATLARGCCIGTAHLPALIATASLLIDVGCQVFGAIAARDRGLVGRPAAPRSR